jgi:hypothetical protein
MSFTTREVIGRIGDRAGYIASNIGNQSQEVCPVDRTAGGNVVRVGHDSADIVGHRTKDLLEMFGPFLEGPQLSPREGEHEIDLGPVGRAIEVRLGSVRRDRNQRFSDEAFPCLPDDDPSIGRRDAWSWLPDE